MESKINDTELKINGIKGKQYSISKITKLLKQFDTIILKATKEEQRKLLELLINKIELFEDLSQDNKIKSIELKFPVNFSNADIDSKDNINMTIDMNTELGISLLQKAKEKVELIKTKKITYSDIKEYILTKFGFKVHSAYIAEVKRNHGIRMYDAPNAVEVSKNPRRHPTRNQVEAIEEALRHFSIIN